MRDILIQGKTVGYGHPPFIVAEMSGNHNQSLDRALAIVEDAAKAGIQALKIQTYTADTITINVNKKDFFINDPKSPWKGMSLYQLYRNAYTPWEWHKPIFERCKKRGIIGFSTPFDETAVDFLGSLKTPCYKIASFEICHLPLIRKVAATGKPIMISTGMASAKEIDEAVLTARKYGCKDIILLKCTSSYPANPEDSNILTIPHMQARYKCQVGISDHTLGIGVAVASVALGACVIEKHFTISRANKGVDSQFSLEPEEMRLLVREASRAWQSLGRVKYGPTVQERKSLVFRRSIYAVKDIKVGEVITRENIKIVRPGLGLAPKYYDDILGRKINKNIKKGTLFKLSMLK